MGFNTGKIWTTGEAVRAADFEFYIRENIDYFKGAQTDQEFVEIEAHVNSQTGYILAEDSGNPTNLQYEQDGGSGGVVFDTRDEDSPTGVDVGNSVQATLNFHETTGDTDQDSAAIKVENVSPGDSGKMEFGIAQSGLVGLSPALLTILPDGKVGVKKTAPAFELDVNGTVEATDLTLNGSSIVTWTESPVGTANYNGAVTIDGQFISTVATGTAPIFPFSVNQLIPNLNASQLNSFEWPRIGDGAIQNSLIFSSPVTLSSNATNFNITFITTNRSGNWKLIGIFNVDVIGTDAGTTFTASFDNANIQNATIKPQSTGNHNFTLVGGGNLASLTVVNMRIQKSSGTGNSTVFGHLVGYWTGP